MAYEIQFNFVSSCPFFLLSSFLIWIFFLPGSQIAEESQLVQISIVEVSGLRLQNYANIYYL